MQTKNKVTDAVGKVFEKADQLVPFGKAERLAAGISMGIPFFLMVADICYEQRAWWWFPLLTVFFVTLPYGVINLAKLIKLKRTYDGIYITVAFTIILTALYFIFTKWFKLVALNSISAYVEIRDAYIFGSLLIAAAALFIANGLVYWNENNKHTGVAGFWRPYGNVVLGVALTGVVHFPYMRTEFLHYFFAVTFFVGCGLATILRSRTKIKHAATDYLTAGVMATGFIILGGKEWLNWSGPLADWVTIFGAESVGLWVIGVDFILVSLKRVPDPVEAGDLKKENNIKAD